MAIITYPLDGIEYSASDAETYLCTRTSGVFAQSGCFDVTVGTGGGSVTVSEGLAWINNDDFCGKSVCVTEPVTLELAASDASNDRIDRVVLRFSRTDNASSLAVKKGVAAQNPSAPAVTRTAQIYELGLCDIYRRAGSVSITAADITDKRLSDVCGLMSDGVTGISTETINSQFGALLAVWREELDELRRVTEETEASGEAMTQTVYNPAGRAGQVAFAPDVLYDDPDGSNSDIVLGHDPEDYDVIEIFYVDQKGFCSSVRCLPTDSPLLCINEPRVEGNNCWVNLKSVGLEFDEDEGEHLLCPVIFAETDGVGGATTASTHINNIFVRRVLGWK